MRRAHLVDVAALILFVAIGRSSHHHPGTPGGFVSTAWPFAVGLGLGWLASARARPAPLSSGVVVCAVTVAAGMTLRVVAGQGTAPAFIVVALGFLGAIMVGGRLLLNRRRDLRPSR